MTGVTCYPEYGLFAEQDVDAVSCFTPPCEQILQVLGSFVGNQSISS